MADLLIGTLAARYRLPAGLVGERRRLDRLLRRTAAEPLALAVELARERLGIRPHELLCLRRVRVPIRLRLSTHDQELITSWSLQLAEAIAHKLETPDSAALVHYGSRTQALADFAAGVARGRLERAWAWRRLGLITGTLPVSLGDAAEQLSDALRKEPTAIVPVLRSLAERCLLNGLAARLPSTGWTALAGAALTAAGAPPLGTLGPSAGECPAQGLTQWLSSAPLLREFMACAGVSGKHPRALTLSWAALAALDAEPGLAASPGRARHLASRVLAMLEGAIEPSMDSLARAGESGKDLQSPDEATPPGGSSDRESVKRTSSPTQRLGVPPACDSHSQGTIDVQGKGPESAPGDPPESILQPTRDLDTLITDPSPVLAGDEPGNRRPGPARVPSVPIREQAPDLDPPKEVLAPSAAREPALTRYAGLLFLIPILDQLSLARRMLEEPALADRPLALGLHLLGRTLAGCNDQDAALAAFRGQPPGKEPPWTRDELADSRLQGAVDGWVEQVREAVFQRLQAQDIGPGNLLLRVIRRNALVHAEPGWIELRMPLDQVSLDIRRAGLDLDPGWVPWLGVVIRYVYQ